MGTWGFEPLENDSALDFIDEFLEVESPAAAVRSALKALNMDGYHDIDVVAHAWAACELVAIASTGGDGHDPDDVPYEAAARLRPNKKLIGQCLDALPRVFDDESELSDLVEDEQRADVEQAIASTRRRLEGALELDKYPRLKVPKIKALHAYAIPAGDRWMVALSDYVRLAVLDIILDEKPDSLEELSLNEAAVLFRCRYMGAIDELDRLGRFRPAASLAEPNGFVIITRHGCMSGSDTGSFETSYLLELNKKWTQLHYEDARNYSYCPELMPDVLRSTLLAYAATGKLELPALPTPAELRDEFLAGCSEEWSPYLEGDGGGPFSFPRVYAFDMSRYLQFSINFHMRKGWTNAGMCLPDDLNMYFLAGMVAACVGAYPEADVPDSLRPLVGELRKNIDRRIAAGAVDVLSHLLDEASVIPHTLQEDPPRRADFFAQASRMRSLLEAKLAAAEDRGT